MTSVQHGDNDLFLRFRYKSQLKRERIYGNQRCGDELLNLDDYYKQRHTKQNFRKKKSTDMTTAGNIKEKNKSTYKIYQM
jgi:hypothetical protein